MNWRAWILVSMTFAGVCRAQGIASGRPRGQGQFRMQTPAFQTEVPTVAADIILGRPTRDSITMSLLSYADRVGMVEYGPSGSEDGVLARSMEVRLKAGEPVELRLAGLKASTRYRYRARLKGLGAEVAGWEHSGTFQTARGSKEGFVFTVQADPHLDYGTVLELYRASLSNVLAAGPDFHVDLGDTFMTDKYEHHEEAAPQYLAQRYWFSQVADQVPLFLVLGNHDGEGPGRGRDPGDGEMGPWSNRMRRRYFPNPDADGFYSTPEGRHPVLGSLQSQYAWNWGTACSWCWIPSGIPRRDGDRTTGDGALDARNTSGSGACWRPIAHGIRSSSSITWWAARGGMPGGVEASKLFEWGGLGADGEEGFASRRAGWEAPIHELLRRRRGVIVFHGHDHFYARQERDGVVYQLVPQPGHRRGGALSASSYGYREGKIVGGSGVLAVRVDDSEVRVQYLRVDGVGGIGHEYRMER